MNNSGYFSTRYSDSFSTLGEVIVLPESGVPLLKRPIDDQYFDLAGLYPITVCRDWSKIDKDLDYMRRLGAVSVVLVGDPFATTEIRHALKHWSVCRDFKTHQVVNLTQDWRSARAKNTRNHTNRSLRAHNFELVVENTTHSEVFWRLYQHTIKRFGITSMAQMSQDAINKQLMVEGAFLCIARNQGKPQGALMGFMQDRIVHLHLMGLAPGARSLSTSYGLIHTVIEHMEGGFDYLNLGGAAGLFDDLEHPLIRFKRRWANDRRISIMCGEVLDPIGYGLLTDSPNHQHHYFPAYRASF